jgi:uncharacterized protein
MLKDPLPRTLDVRKAAARGVSVKGSLELAELPRFRPLLAGDEGQIQATLALSRDEEHHSIIDVTVVAEVSVTCQRCLEAMITSLRCSNRLAVVWTDEQAKHLPRDLDPLICEDDCALWDLVEDELILALPAYSYHEGRDCNQLLNELGDSDAAPSAADTRQNPFEVLAQLKPGKE